MRIAVIGGGIQGTCIAMELALRGVQIDLIESSHSIMEGASRHNEGKIHLGFVYANDPTLRTAELMARGAARFYPLMHRWLGASFDQLRTSTPFNYAVHVDSLLSPDRLEGVYREMSRRMRTLVHQGSYFGVDDPHVITRVSGSDLGYGPDVDSVFATREIAINPGLMADLLAITVAETDDIRVVTDTTVTSVDPVGRRLEVAMSDERLTLGPYDHVVNCAWGGRPLIDWTAGMGVAKPSTFRMKYFLVASAPPAMSPLPSTTVVLGGFGDLVNYGVGEYYLSWYPSGRLGWSTELSPPAWPTRPEPNRAMAIARDILDNLGPVIPGSALLGKGEGNGPDVRGGVIYSLGNTDVDDPHSEFHRRSEIGPVSRGQYHSVDTGKYTTAPLFAVATADRITGVP